MRDEAQPDQLLPDVYLKHVIPERPVSPDRPDALEIVRESETRQRRESGAKSKFQPVLEPLVEIAEAAA